MLIAVGIALLVAGLYFLYDGLLLVMSCRQETTGTLIAIDIRYGYDFRDRNAKVYVPVYSYIVDGKEYKSDAKIYKEKIDSLEIGSTATVKYNQKNPNLCVINHRNGKIGVAIIFCIFGLFLCFIGK